MNKQIFLLQLERLLYDLPREERQEAMEYYRSYFEDAGEENEAAVLEELGSPQKVAASIKEGLGGSERTSFVKNPPQVHGTKDRSDGSDTEGQPGAGTYEYGKKSGGYRRYYEGKQDGQAGAAGQQGEPGSAGAGASKWIMLLVVAILSVPIWGSVLSFLMGIVGVVIALVVVLGVFSVGGLIGGFVCAIIGIIRLCMLSLIQGLLLLGVGMLLIAGGGLSIVLLILLCGRFLPWALGQISDLFHKLWNWGRSMA